MSDGWIAEVNEKSASIRIMGMQGDPMRARSSDGRGEIVVVDCAAADDEQPFAAMLDERVAFAHLIAAAPELLASLNRLLLEFDFMIERGHIPDVRDDVIFAAARAAVAKAEPPSSKPSDATWKTGQSAENAEGEGSSPSGLAIAKAEGK